VRESEKQHLHRLIEHGSLRAPAPINARGWGRLRFARDTSVGRRHPCRLLSSLLAPHHAPRPHPKVTKGAVSEDERTLDTFALATACGGDDKEAHAHGLEDGSDPRLVVDVDDGAVTAQARL
jgi:hypothetical protein